MAGQNQLIAQQDALLRRQDVIDADNTRDVRVCQELAKECVTSFTRHWDTPQGSLSCDSSVGATTTPLSEDTRKRASRDAATMMGRMNLIAKLEALKEDEDGTATEKVIHLLVGTTDLSNVESVGEVSAH